MFDQFLITLQSLSSLSKWDLITYIELSLNNYLSTLSFSNTFSPFNGYWLIIVSPLPITIGFTFCFFKTATTTTIRTATNQANNVTNNTQ